MWPGGQERTEMVVMLSMFAREIVVQRQQELLEEVRRMRASAALRGPSPRETMAKALIALAVWLAPSTRSAVAGQTAQVAHGARA